MKRDFWEKTAGQAISSGLLIVFAAALHGHGWAKPFLPVIHILAWAHVVLSGILVVGWIFLSGDSVAEMKAVALKSTPMGRLIPAVFTMCWVVLLTYAGWAFAAALTFIFWVSIYVKGVEWRKEAA